MSEKKENWHLYYTHGIRDCGKAYSENWDAVLQENINRQVLTISVSESPEGHRSHYLSQLEKMQEDLRKDSAAASYVVLVAMAKDILTKKEREDAKAHKVDVRVRASVAAEAISAIGDSVESFSRSMFRRLKSGGQRPPGEFIGSFASFLYPKKTYENTFRPTILDEQIEHEEAVRDGRLTKAWLIKIRCTLRVCRDMLGRAPYTIFQIVLQLMKFAG